MALAALCGLVFGPIGCLDGGPHPEPPDPLGPPADRLDSGVDLDNPSEEGVGVMEPPGAGAGGAAGGAGAGGSGGVGGAGGDNSPTACTDASVEGGWDDEDSGALR